MSAALAALFRNHERADAARAMLLRDGVPTERVSLTSEREPGPAGLAGAAELEGKLTRYFKQVLYFEDEREVRQRFVEEILEGAAALIVEPRSLSETDLALQILDASGAIEVHGHDLANQG